MFDEPKLMSVEPEKSIAQIIFERIQDLPPLRAKEELMQAKEMYQCMLNERADRSAKELEHHQIQLKEFQS